jgi:hypothetical protein
VLSRDIRVDEIDGRQWINLLALFEPDYAAYLGDGAARPPLLLVLEGGVPVKALRLGQGRVPLGEVRWHGAAEIARARRENRCSILVAIELGTVDVLLREIESRVRSDEDAVAQGLRLLRAVAVHLDQGLYVAPRLLRSLPIPPYEAVQRTFDLAYPDERAAVFYVFDGAKVHTSLLTYKRGGDLTRLSTGQLLGVTIGDWRRDYRRLLGAVERQLGRPFLGVFGELGAWQRILSGGAGGFAREIAHREIILDPAPPWLLGLVAADAGASVAQASAGFLWRRLPQTLQDVARGIAGKAAEMGPFALLGFNPFAVAAELIALGRKPPA